jgi:ribosome-binding factor A
VLGNSSARKRSMQGLRSAHGILQRAVASELRLKHTPTLEFLYDDTSERGMRIAELIDREAGE